MIQSDKGSTFITFRLKIFRGIKEIGRKKVVKHAVENPTQPT